MPDTASVAPHVEAARAARRRQLLASGLSGLLAERPWSEVRMVDVATAAGVSRQTLYDEFGSRQGLAEAYVASETERFLAMVDVALAAHAADPHAAVEAAMTTFLTAAGAGGVLRAIATDDGNHELLALVTTHGQSVLDAATARLAAWFQGQWPAADPPAVRLGVRTLVRLALSHATSPDGPPGVAATEVADLLAPYLRQVLGAAPT